MILKREFYERNPLGVAKELLGKTLVHETAQGTTSGMIVETETQFGPKGHAYVYLIYGMYYCFNVISGKIPAKPEAVFFRALQPLEGIELMAKRRPTANCKLEHLANGPSKLCMAMNIAKLQNGADLTKPPFYIRADGVKVSANNIVQAPRIGVDYANEWVHKPWRFYISDNPFVSVKAK